jgi:hypothetical protein
MFSKGDNGGDDKLVQFPAAVPATVPSIPILKRLLKSQAGQQDQIDDLGESISAIKSAMGEDIKRHVKKHNLDKEMFAVARKLSAMSDERLAYHLPNLLYYIDACGLDERAKNAPPLPMGDGFDTPDSVEGD